MRLAPLLFFLFSVLTLWAEPTVQKVSLQLPWKHQFEYAGYYAAIKKGYYRDLGLELNLKEYTHQSGSVVSSVVSGEADFGIWTSDLILQRLRGEPVVMLSNTFKHSPYVIVARKDSGILYPEDLAGKRIMNVPGTENMGELLSMLKSARVGEDEIKWIPHSFDAKKLLSGEVDGMTAYVSNELYHLKQEKLDYTLIHPSSYGVDYYGNSLFTSQHMLDRHPEVVKKFITATQKGWRYALEHKREMASYIQEEVKSTKAMEALLFEAEEIEKLVLPNVYPIGSINPERVQKIALSYRENGLVGDLRYLQGFIYGEKSYTPLRFSAVEKEVIKRHPVIKLGIDIGWPPFEYVESGIYKGMAADYMALVEERMGVKFEPDKEHPWSEVVERVKARKLDAYSCAVGTEERKAYMNFTRPYLSFPMVIITTKDVTFVDGIRDLKGKKVAVAKGYATHDILKDKHPELELLVADSVKGGIHAVSTGQAFAFIGNIATSSYLLQKEGITNVKISGEMPYKYELAMGIRKDWPELLPIVQKVMDSISEEERNQIYRRWISLRYEKKLDYSTLWDVLAILVVVIGGIIWWNITLSREVGRRKLAESAQWESQERLQLALAGGQLGIWDWNLTRGDVMIDERWAEILGYRKDEVVLNSSTIPNYVCEEDLERVMEKIQAHLDRHEEFYEIDFRMKHKDGHKHWVHAGGRVVEWNQNGEPIRMVGTQQDIHDRKMAEYRLMELNRGLEEKVDEGIQKYKQQQQLLIQQSKMASMGEMIGIIAHQWRQPLNAISIIIEDIVDAYEHEDLSKEYMEANRARVIQQVQFMNKTISNFRNFYQPNKEKENFEVSECLDKALLIMKNQIERHSIRLDIHSEKIEVFAVQNELEQVLLGLINNAVDALVSNKIKEPLIRIIIRDEGERVRLVIRDNAGGITDSIMEKIFNPYFTTKGAHGTGIGLYMSRLIIEESMQGEISARNSGNGAEFIIVLKK